LPLIDAATPTLRRINWISCLKYEKLRSIKDLNSLEICVLISKSSIN